MIKEKYIMEKSFSPLDDLYVLLESLEKTLQSEINDEDYVIGRKQLFYTFLHETIHAFITKKAKWVHELDEDETDFIDELATRIIIDDVIKRLNIFEKMDTFYEKYVHHKNELELYGYKLSENNYNKIEEEWYKKYSKENNIDAFCRYLLEYYKNNKTEIGREEDFKY
jgi:translation elongation factor EF-Ts